GRYRVLGEIGRGGMGWVLHVEHLFTGAHLALKVLSRGTGAQSGDLERFKIEARAPALIRSKHVVRVTDADVAAELDGALFLVMELLDGLDLEQYLARRQRMSHRDTLIILAQAAQALDRAHAVGIVHRDLKPANMFLHRDDGGMIVKLLDFGIST